MILPRQHPFGSAGTTVEAAPASAGPSPARGAPRSAAGHTTLT